MSSPNSELKDLAERAPFGSGTLFASTRKRAELNRQACTLDAENGATYYTHDEVGNVTAIVDPLEQASYFTYDAVGRTLWAKNPFAETTYFGYDENGNQASVLAPGGEVAYYAYDPVNRLSVHRADALDTDKSIPDFPFPIADCRPAAGQHRFCHPERSGEAALPCHPERSGEAAKSKDLSGQKTRPGGPKPMLRLASAQALAAPHGRCQAFRVRCSACSASGPQHPTPGTQHRRLLVTRARKRTRCPSPTAPSSLAPGRPIERTILGVGTLYYEY